MKLPTFDSPRMASFLLLCAGAVLIVVSILLDRDGITSAALVITGCICFFCGIFILTFSRGEPFDPTIVSLLPVSGCINLCRITADLGIMGSAHFLPEPFHQQTGVMQYIPVSRYDNRKLNGDTSFVLSGCGGALVVPACAALMKNLRETHNLNVPSDPPGLDLLIKELGEEVLECVQSVRVKRRDDHVFVILSGYLFIRGCKIMSAESPRCCMVNPCPVCSLFGVLIAESEQKPVEVERCDFTENKNEVMAAFLILQPGKPLPRDADPGNSG